MQYNYKRNFDVFREHRIVTNATAIVLISMRIKE